MAMAANPINVGTAERVGSAIGGGVLILRALARPTLGRVVAGLGGLALLQRGLTGHCGLYQRLGFDTAEAEGANRSAPRERRPDPVLAASEDSFPASDPPSWTPVAGTAR